MELGRVVLVELLVSTDYTVDASGVEDVSQHDLACLERCFSKPEFEQLEDTNLRLSG